MTVDGRRATGLRLAAVGKLLAAASRPCTLLVLQPDAAAARAGASSGAASGAAADADDEGGGGAAVAPRAPTRADLLEAGRVLAQYAFGPGALGVTLREESGAVLVDSHGSRGV